MPDYSQGKIYRLTCNNLDLVYYGSTCQKLTRRFDGHKSSYNKWKTEKSTNYCASYKLFETGGVEIELVLDYPCECKRELEEIEQTFIENDDCCNKIRAFLSTEERKKYMKEFNQSEKYKEIQKAYGQTEKYREYQKAYGQSEKYREYQKAYGQTEKYREYQKAYRQTEKYREYQKAYRQKKKLKTIE